MGMTKDQNKAYLADEGKFLVSAGAGCGKTFVLTMRVLRLILEKGVSLDNMLILTFTNAAAASMKSKIRNRISSTLSEFDEDSDEYIRLSNELELVDSASIQTYDSFCNSIVKKYNYDVNVPKSFTLLDYSIYSIMRKKVVEDIIENKIKSNDEGVLNYLKYHCVKDANNLINLIINFMDYAQGSGREDDVYNNFINDNYSEDKFNKDKAFLLDKFLQIGDNFYAKIREFEDMGLDECYLGYRSILDEAKKKVTDDFDRLSYFEKWQEMFRPFDRNAVTFKGKSLDERIEAYQNNLKSHRSIRFRGNARNEDTSERVLCESVLGGENVESLQNYCSKDVKKSLNDLIINLSFSVINENKKYAETIVDCAKEAKVIVDENTIGTGMMTFDQIFNKALEALKIEKNQKELNTKYEYVFIDEYQDTNPKQEVLINDLLKPNNVFMVGDMKQSIYGFRGADPSLFMHKFNTFVDIDKKDEVKDAEGYLITLSDNFRSRREIISQTNDMFDVAMTEETGGIDFKDKNQRLNFGNKMKYENNKISNGGLSSIVYNAEKYDPEVEAQLIADDIKTRLINKELVVHGDSLEPCNLSDFAILIRGKKHFNVYKKVFHDNNLSLLIVDDFDISDSEVVRTLKNLLRLCELKMTNSGDVNKLKYSFASVYRSFLYGNNPNRDDELDAILSIKDNDPLLKSIYSHEILEKINNVVNIYENKCNVEGFIKAVLNAFEFEENLLRLDGYKDNFVVVKTMKETARTFDQLGKTKLDFIEHVQNIYKYSEEIKTERNLPTKESVTLMTIHKSKGLEFTNIYLPLLTKGYNYGSYGKYETVDELGITIPNPKQGKDNYNTIITLLGKDKTVNETISEEIRLFYVALTRAKERAILVYNQPVDTEGGDEKETMLATIPQVEEIKYYVDAVNKCYNEHVEFLFDKEYDLKFISEDEISKLSPNNIPFQASEDENTDTDLNITFIDSENRYHFEDPVFIKRASKEMDELVDPRLIEYGNKIHASLEACDIKNKDASIIKDHNIRKMIEGVFKIGTIFSDIDKAVGVFKEYSYYDESSGNNGIIDLLIVYEDDLSIVDYKTKNIDSPEYDKQLKEYEKYIKTVFPDKKIDKYLISIMTGTFRKVD